MAKQFILGAGLIGSELSRQLIARGDQVVVGTRSGTQLPGAAAVSVNANDASALTQALTDAETLYICTNPLYELWAEEWPAIGAATIEAAHNSGAKLIMMGNLYAHGIPTEPMTAQTPFAPADTKGQVRADLSEAIFAAHRRGDIKAAEIRASDYFGPAATVNAHLGNGFFEPLLAGKTARVVGNPALKHSWAYIPDIAKTMIAVANRDEALGRPWIAPHASDASRNDIADQVAQIAGRQNNPGKVAGIPQWLLRSIGLINPRMREVAASSYQFRHEFLADSSETERAFGFSATPFTDALEPTLVWIRQNPAA